MSLYDSYYSRYKNSPTISNALPYREFSPKYREIPFPPFPLTKVHYSEPTTPFYETCGSVLMDRFCQPVGLIRGGLLVDPVFDRPLASCFNGILKPIEFSPPPMFGIHH